MISGLAVSIIIAHVLGPEGRGLYALVMTTIVMSASFGVFGLSASNTYFAAKDSRKARTIGIQSLATGLIGTLMSIIAIYLIQSMSPSVLNGLNDTLLLTTYTLIPLFLWGNLFAFAYLGRGRILAFNTFETTQRIIFCGVSLIVLWYLDSTLETFLNLVSLFISVLVALYIINYFRDAMPGPIYESGYTSVSMVFGIKSYIATMLTLAIMRSGVLFVNYYGGNDDAGYFAVAQQISELLIIIPTTIGTILFGRVSRGDGNHLTPVVLRIMTWVLLPVTLGILLISQWLIVTVFGAEFSRSIVPLRIMLPGAFLLGLEVIIAKDLAGRGYPWPAVLAWVPVLVINVAGFMYLIPRFGVNGAALAIAISFSLIFVLITGYYLWLTEVTLGSLFLLRSDDIRDLRFHFSTFLNETFLFQNKGIHSADTAIPDKNKIEIQSLAE